jgi:hypothetical protein
VSGSLVAPGDRGERPKRAREINILRREKSLR